MKVLYCVSHPIQYFAPFFRELAHVEDFDFRVVFGTDHGTKPSYDPGFGRVVDFGIDLLGGYDSIFLRRGIQKRNRFFELYVTKWDWIREYKPDAVIISGWRSLMMWQIAVYCFVRGIPVFVRADSTLPRGQEGGRQAWKKRLAQPFKRALMGRLRGAFAAGSAGVRYFQAMGMAPHRIHPIPFFVDTALVAKMAMKGKEQRAVIRQEFDIPDDAFLGVALGKLIGKKNPFVLVDLLAKAPRSTHIAWIGSGVLEEELADRIRHAGLEARFHLLGFRPPEEAWRFFGAADFFIMPSTHEPWGLSVNEAVAAGLPVLLSSVCGCSDDLVREGENGYVLNDFGSDVALEKLRDLQNRRVDSVFQENLRKVSAEISGRHSIKAARGAMLTVFGTTVRLASPAPSYVAKNW